MKDWKIKTVFLLLSVVFISVVKLVFFSGDIYAEYVLQGPYEYTENIPPDTRYDNYQWVFLPPANVDGYNVIGVDVNLGDGGGDWDANPVLIDVSGHYYIGENDVWDSCGKHCLDAWPNYCCVGENPCFDICTGGTEQNHRYIVNGWEDGNVDIRRLNLTVYKDNNEGSSVTLSRITWIYVIKVWNPTEIKILNYSAISDCGTSWSGKNQDAAFTVEYGVASANATYGIELAGAQFTCSTPNGWYGGLSCPTKGQTINGIKFNNVVQVGTTGGSVTITWYLESISKEGIGLPVRAYLRRYDGLTTGWVTLGTWNVDLSPPEITIGATSDIHKLNLKWSVYEPGSVSSSLRKARLRYCVYSAQSKIDIWYTDPDVYVRYYCQSPLIGNVEDILDPVDPFNREETVSVPEGLHFVQMAVDDFACNLSIKDQQIDVPGDSEPGGLVGDPWLLTAFGDTFAYQGYSNMEMHQTSFSVPKLTSGDAFFSTYIISKYQQSWTSNRRSFQEPDYLLDSYNDDNRNAFNDIYTYMHSLYDSNSSACTSSGVTVREVTDFSSAQDASCTNNKLYFVDNESSTASLPDGWLGQAKSSDKACLIVSKGPIEIPDEVNSQDQIDALFLSEGDFSTKTKVIGGITTTITDIHDIGAGWHDTTMTLGSDGLPFIAWYPGWLNEIAFPYVTKCNNSDCSDFTAPHTLINPSASGAFNISSTMTGDGYPILLYSVYSNGWKLSAVKCYNEDCSNNTKVLMSAVSNLTSSRPAVTVVADAEENRYPLIFYPFLSGNIYSLYLKRCGNNACSSNNTTINLKNAMYSDLSEMVSDVVIPSDNRPIIAYTDSVNYGGIYESLAIIKCGDYTCSSGNFSRKIYGTSTQFVSGNISLIVDENDIPVISFIDNDGNLHVIKCGNPSCSSANPIQNTIIHSGAVSMIEQNSIALGKESPGLPIVAFQDRTNGLLRTIKCSNPSCSDKANNISTIVAGGGAIVGYYQSIVVPEDNRPFIVFYDYTNFKVKAIKCADAACAVPEGSGGGFSNDNSLIMNGSVISNTVNFGRVLSDNTQNPAEILTYDPKYLDIFRDCLGEPYSFKIREYNYISSGN